jgi:DMSO reductase anchor subunit
MHPAYSVIVFTTASGAGYGLLFWLAVLGALGVVPPVWGFGLAGLALAFMLIGAGLLSSTAHLGHPERAWRAFSQWRSSWLSREGVAAVLTFVPMVMLAADWLLGGVVGPAAWLAAAAALATVYCTGMIYQSLPTIRAWHHPLVAPVYVALALATGAVLVALLAAIAGLPLGRILWLAALAVGAGWLLKAGYWSSIDAARRSLTPGHATGLGRFGKVRALEPAHSQPNFVMREMGYQVARKHALKLRGIATALLFLLPLVLVLAALVLGPMLAIPLLGLATLSAAAGVLVERWLFFAEAEHVVTLFYGRDAA